MTKISGLDSAENFKPWKICRFIHSFTLEPTSFHFQVLRYQRHGNPLWVSKLNIPNKSDIPKCPCGAERTFEFQVFKK